MDDQGWKQLRMADASGGRPREADKVPAPGKHPRIVPSLRLFANADECKGSLVQPQVAQFHVF